MSFTLGDENDEYCLSTHTTYLSSSSLVVVLKGSPPLCTDSIQCKPDKKHEYFIIHSTEV